MRTQIAQREAEQDAPLLLKFRVNEKYTQSIADFLDVRERTKKEEKMLTTKRTTEVGKEEAFAYQRKDAVGNKQADTGTEMFFEGKNGNAISFIHLVDDLKESGYSLIDVFSYQKEGDRMSFICFKFNKEKSAGFPKKVTDLLKVLCDKSWEHTHIWDNPNGSITINAAHLTERNVCCLRMDRTDAQGMLTGADSVAPQEGIYFTIHDC